MALIEVEVLSDTTHTKKGEIVHMNDLKVCSSINTSIRRGGSPQHRIVNEDKLSKKAVRILKGELQYKGVFDEQSKSWKEQLIEVPSSPLVDKPKLKTMKHKPLSRPVKENNISNLKPLQDELMDCLESQGMEELGSELTIIPNPNLIYGLKPELKFYQLFSYWEDELNYLNIELTESKEFVKELRGAEKTKESRYINKLVFKIRDLNKKAYNKIITEYRVIISLELLEQKYKEYKDYITHKNQIKDEKEANTQTQKQFATISNNKIIPELLQGDYTNIKNLDTSFILNDELSIYSNPPLKIKFNIKTRVFKIYQYYIREGELSDEEVEIIFGLFVKLKKFKRTEYTISGMVNKKDVYIIQIQNTLKSDDEDTQEFNLRNSKLMEIAKHIKIGTQKDQSLIPCYEMFFNWLRDSIDIKTNNITSTNCYTILNKETILLPNTSTINDKLKFNNEDNGEELELSKFEETFNKETRISFESEDLKEVRQVFKSYLKSSYRARLTASYSLISIFRQMLMREFKLKAFYNLALVSNKSNTGKSTIVRLCCNNLLTGLDTPGNSADLLKGTTQRITGFSYISTPLCIDDLKSITNNSTIDLLKTSATSPAGYVKKYPNNKATYYYNLRPLLVSCNRFEISDPNLADRFIIANYENLEIKRREEFVSEETINYILDNSHILRYKLWDNIDKLLDEIYKLKIESDRSKSTDTIFNLGNILLNKYFEILGDDTKPFNDEFGLYFDNSKDVILTTDDLIKNNIFEELEKLTSIKYKKADDMSNLLSEYNFRYLLNREVDEVISKNIIYSASEKHIKIIRDHKNNKLRIGISKIALDSMKFKDFKITELRQFKDYFEGYGTSTRLRGSTKVYFIELDTYHSNDLEEEQ